MRPEDIEAMIKAKPFVPFRIHLSNGQSVDISHPETLMLSRSRMEHGTPHREGSLIVDKVNYYAYVHMVRIELLESKPSQTV